VKRAAMVAGLKISSGSVTLSSSLIVSFIEDHKVIDKIIAHLKLIFHAEEQLDKYFIKTLTNASN